MGLNRLHQPGTFHFITNRCEHEQFLMRPSKEITDIILGWLVKAHSKYGDNIEVYAFIFLSNHFHILLRNNGNGLAQFMCYLQSNIAKDINRHLDRNGRFFARKYDDIIVEGDDAFLNRYSYVHANAVKAGLVNTASQWPGVNSIHHALSGEKFNVKVLNRSKYHNATRGDHKRGKEDHMESFQMELSTPPMWADRTQSEIATLIKAELESAEYEYQKKRGFKPSLGSEKVLEQKHTDRPKKASRKPRFKILCFDEERLIELLESYRNLVSNYRRALDGFRTAALKGNRRAIVEWPQWLYPPSSTFPIQKAPT